MVTLMVLVMVHTQVSEDVWLYVVFWRAGTGIVGLVTCIQHMPIEDWLPQR
jgi:hypothetical protein